MFVDTTNQTNENQDLGPSTLVIPIDAQGVVQQEPHADSALLFVILIGVILGGVGLFALLGIHRRRRIQPNELVFHKIAKQLGYSRKEMNSIRMYCKQHHHTSPIGVLMNSDLLSEALQSRSLARTR